MSNCVDMKEEEKEVAPILADPQRPKYPYGLRLHLDAKQLQKLGVTKLPPVGEKFCVEAMSEVCAVSAEETANWSDNASVTLQITSLNIKTEEEEKAKEQNVPAAAKKLYGVKG